MRDSIKVFFVFILAIAFFAGIYFSIMENVMAASVSWTTVFWTVSSMILTSKDTNI